MDNSKKHFLKKAKHDVEQPWKYDSQIYQPTGNVFNHFSTTAF
jgi:hypothetical protein